MRQTNTNEINLVDEYFPEYAEYLNQEIQIWKILYVN